MADALQMHEFDYCQAVILSGGRAQRAGGGNKSLLRVEGRPILEHQLDRLRPLFADRIAVVTDRPEDYAPFGLRTLPDPDIGASAPDERFPLRGLAAALAACAGGWCFLLACDMPWPEPAVVERQWRHLNEYNAGTLHCPAEGLCIETSERIEPFHAFYRGSLASAARLALRGGDRSLRGWIARQPLILKLDPSELELDAEAARRCLANFNRAPEAL